MRFLGFQFTISPLRFLCIGFCFCICTGIAFLFVYARPNLSLSLSATLMHRKKGDKSEVSEEKGAKKPHSLY